MIDNTAKPRQTDNQAVGCIVRIATPIANRFHQSSYSHFEVTLPSRKVTTFAIPLDAAIAIEEAGYVIKLVGRLNG